jgi:hypothetical protein
MYLAKYLQRIPLVLVLVLLSCSCSTQKELPLYITAVPGKPPCWMSLCIGDIADMDLALKQLNNTEGMQKAVKTKDAPNFFSFIWQDPENPANNIWGNLTIIEFHINLIILSPDSLHTLGQFIKEFGNPDCVIVKDSYDNKKTLMVKYSQKGLMLDLDYGPDSNLVTKQTQIRYLTLFNLQSQYLSCETSDKIRSYRWAGLKQTYP